MIRMSNYGSLGQCLYLEHGANNVRYFLKTILVLIAAIPNYAFAENAEVDGSTTYEGACLRRIGDVEERDYCDSTISVLRYIDNAMSFQFNSKERIANGMNKYSIGFAGPGLTMREESGKKIYEFPVTEITTYDADTKNIYSRKASDAYCVFEFSGDKAEPKDLKSLRCQYRAENKNIVYSASNLRFVESPQKRAAILPQKLPEKSSSAVKDTVVPAATTPENNQQNPNWVKVFEDKSMQAYIDLSSINWVRDDVGFWKILDLNKKLKDGALSVASFDVHLCGKKLLQRKSVIHQRGQFGGGKEIGRNDKEGDIERIQPGAMDDVIDDYVCKLNH